MLDLGFLTFPTLAAVAVLFSALFIGEEIVIERMHVSHQLEWSGYKSEVATRRLTDEIRELAQAAQSEIAALNVDEGSLEKGITALEDYFEIGQLINGVRNMMGLIPYYINGEVTEKRGEAVLTVRVTSKKDERVHLVEVRGNIDELPDLMEQAALEILEYINPYVVALHLRRLEMAAGQFDFPRTKQSIENFLSSRPVAEHYLAYGLAGRMYMLKAERDPDLSEAQRQQAYDEAMRYLDAALLQQPDFLFPIINLALIHRDSGNIALAEQYFARAVKLNPNYLITRRAWAEMLRDQGRFHEATIQYVAAVEVSPDNADLRHELAKIYLNLGEFQEARAQVQEAMRLDPRNEGFRLTLARLENGEACTPLNPVGCETLQ